MSYLTELNKVNAVVNTVFCFFFCHELFVGTQRQIELVTRRLAFAELLKSIAELSSIRLSRGEMQ